MESIFIGVAIGLGVHIGKKAIDKLWNAISPGVSPIVDGRGNLSAVSSGQTTIVPREFTTSSPTFANVVGRIYLPENIEDFLTGDEIAIVLVVEETGNETLLFRANLETGYEIALPFGIYSFYVFLVDGAAASFYDAELYAMGFPSRIDLSDATGFSLEDVDDVWNLVVDSPLEFSPENDAYQMDFILVDSLRIPGQPQFIADLDDVLRADAPVTGAADLTGSWILREEHEFGSTAGHMFLLHVGDTLSGIVVIHDTMDDGSELVLQEIIEGSVDGREVEFEGTSVRVLIGYSDAYNLDSWEGVVVSPNLIEGRSVDEQGVEGAFQMQRID